MSQKRTGRFTIRAVPWRPSLATAGQQSSIDELTGCWKARNVSSDLDGLITQRPGLTQWGQTLKKPDTTLLNTNADSVTTVFLDFLNGIDSLAETDSSTGSISTTTKQGSLRTNVLASDDTSKNYTLSYTGTTTGNTWSLRFMFRGVGLPTYGADAVDDAMVIRGAKTATAAGKEFGIWAGGLYYRNNSDSKYTLVTGSSAVGAGGWVCVEIRCDEGTSGVTSFYLDDTLLESVTTSSIKSVSMIDAGALFEFQWEVEGSGSAGTQYTTHLSTVMYTDTIVTPFETLTVTDISGYKYHTASNAAKRCVLAGVGKYIYHDNALEGAWRPLHPKQYSDVFFAPYRETMIWSDNNGVSKSNLWQWDGRNDPELLDTAPFITAMTEHLQRLWGIAPGTDRVYYSGDRQPNVWYYPSATNIEDEFETALDAGYIEIPLKHGDRNTALFGDYYNTIVIFTKRGVWQIQGSGLFSWSRRNISQQLGCTSAHGVTQVENNIWFVSDRGLAAIVPVDSFGDIQAQLVSAPIADLWRAAPSSVETIAQDFLHKAILRVNTPLNLVYMAVPLAVDIEPDNIYIFNVNLKSFLGPWEITSRCMDLVEIGPPTREVMMHGDASGRVGYTNVFTNADFGSTAIEMELESPILTGRSLEQSFPGISTMKKTWKTLRLWVLPRGDWDIDIVWYVDNDVSSGSVSKNQNIFKSYVLGDTEGDGTGDFRLDVDPDGALASLETVGYIEIDLEKSGYGFYWNVQQLEANETAVIQGWEVDGIIEGYEES